MIPITMHDMQVLVAAAVFFLGCVSLVLGIVVLMSRGYNREVRAIAAHTARLGQKGMAEEVSGLVSSASQLILAINQLVRTSSGIGIFLISLGLAMIGSAYWLVRQMAWTPA